MRHFLAWRGKSRHVLVWGRRSFNVNEKNIEGQTALDMYISQQGQTQEGDNGEMRVILDGAGALTASSLITVAYVRHIYGFIYLFFFLLLRIKSFINQYFTMQMAQFC